MTPQGRWESRAVALIGRVAKARRGAVLLALLALAGILLITVAGSNVTSLRAHAQGATPFGASSNPCSAPSIFKHPGPINPRPPVAANSLNPATVHAPSGSPPYFQGTYASFLREPRPDKIYDDGGIPAVVPENEFDPDAAGCIEAFQPDGPTTTATNAFFQSLGTNGRSCITCHQPPSGMSVSVQNINDRLHAPNGQHDPIFAPVDGSDCPDLVPAANTSGAPLGRKTGKGTDFNKSHSLILARGVFRIFLPVPANADFTISVVSDPYGCNEPPNNTTSSGAQQISVYRRPLISGNLAFVTNTRDGTLAAAVPPSTVPTPNSRATDPVYGTPICVEGGGISICTDPLTNRPISGNIMWDGREPDLEQQAIDATLGHAQAR